MYEKEILRSLYVIMKYVSVIFFKKCFKSHFYHFLGLCTYMPSV